MAIYLKGELRRVYPEEMVWKEADSEECAHLIGQILGKLNERGVLTDQDIIDIVPDAFRHYEIGPEKDAEE